MIPDTLAPLFKRDLDKLKAEINAYFHESTIWQTLPGTTNSAGNLCLHLIGNLNHYIGAVLGNTGYVRHREKEFEQKDVPRKDLLLAIDYTSNIIKQVLENLSEADLERQYPLKMFDANHSTEYILIHLATHLNYHLGQINYHRRLAHYIP
ncbi:uncharacterized protein DUF1572 [Chitinophaga skermanii]|uniref:Uncharacterized protein DUF1572 n=1 Tax=Chitinophaga skermanii TaxID=331697 RepID=A0A327QK16_9BACT|nr:DUF1572 family protein [Chitinophaga skermanii]RAJ04034.1 uncharacterized protein DUF1572 [Chitinophaga skermanii]